MSAYLAGFGRYLPQRVVTNAEMASRVGKTAEWIENASGIRERRYATPEEGVVEMGVAASADCLKRLGVSSSQVNLVISASGSGASGFPGPAAAIAHGLGLGAIPALDVPIASAGSVFGLALAMHLAPAYGNVLLVASEKMSALVGNDPNTAILFGDGAGAALITNQPARWQLKDAVLHSDGQYRDALAYDGTLRMNGMTVLLLAVRKMPEVMEELLARNQMTAAQVDAFLGPSSKFESAHTCRKNDECGSAAVLHEYRAIWQHVVGIDVDRGGGVGRNKSVNWISSVLRFRCWLPLGSHSSYPSYRRSLVAINSSILISSVG